MTSGKRHSYRDPKKTKQKNNSSQGLEWTGGDYAGQEGFLGQYNYYF